MRAVGPQVVHALFNQLDLGIDLSDFADWGDPERIAVNVATLYREFHPSLPEAPVPELFVRMARRRARH
jgi:cyclase